jgi:hypothetical protein
MAGDQKKPTVGANNVQPDPKIARPAWESSPPLDMGRLPAHLESRVAPA